MAAVLQQAESDSEDELVDDDWPDDFFVDDDDVKDVSKPELVNIEDMPTLSCLDRANLAYPKLDGPAEFKHLPFVLLVKIVEPLGIRDRCAASQINRKMREAVSKSDCKGFGDGRLEVSVQLTNDLVEDVRVYLCGVKEFRNKIARNWTTYDAAARPFGEFDFGHFKRLFKKLHLKKLIVRNVPLSHSLFHSLAAFLVDWCTFDSLTLKMHKTDSWAKTIETLVARAQKYIMVELGPGTLSTNRALAIPHPVTFHNATYNESSWGTFNFFTDYIFMELVFHGHSIIRFSTMLRSVECLNMVVESVSAASTSQKIDVRGLNYEICKEYVESVNATPMPLPESANEIPSADGVEMQAFRHVRATIFLIGRKKGRSEGRLIVASENYVESD